MNFPKCSKPDASSSTTTTSISTSSTSTTTTSTLLITPKKVISRWKRLFVILSSHQMGDVFKFLLAVLVIVGFIAAIYATVDPSACRRKGEELQLPYHWTFSEGCKVEIEEGYWISPSEVTTWLLKKVKSVPSQ